MNRNPKVGDTLDVMEKELVKIKVAGNGVNPFKKENKTFYVGNEDNRSSLNNWKNYFK